MWCFCWSFCNFSYTVLCALYLRVWLTFFWRSKLRIMIRFGKTSAFKSCFILFPLKDPELIQLLNLMYFRFLFVPGYYIESALGEYFSNQWAMQYFQNIIPTVLRNMFDNRCTTADSDLWYNRLRTVNNWVFISLQKIADIFYVICSKNPTNRRKTFCI